LKISSFKKKREAKVDFSLLLNILGDLLNRHSRKERILCDKLKVCLSGGMVDALDLGSSAPGVEVRVLSKAIPKLKTDKIDKTSE
jgi:hypothetical protein